MCTCHVAAHSLQPAERVQGPGLLRPEDQPRALVLLKADCSPLHQHVYCHSCSCCEHIVSNGQERTAPAEGLLHYYDEPDPARALALLEEEMSAAVPPPGSPAPDADGAGRSAGGLEALARLLAVECEAQAWLGRGPVLWVFRAPHVVPGRLLRARQP